MIEHRNEKGELHRTDGPAVVRLDGSREWYLNGKLHRTDDHDKRPTFIVRLHQRYCILRNTRERVELLEKLKGEERWLAIISWPVSPLCVAHLAHGAERMDGDGFILSHIFAS
jgi:hypothetical protein